MCGRYQFLAEDEDVIQEIHRILSRLNEKYSKPQIHLDEIRPTNLAPVIRGEGAGTDVSLMAWGFPQWDRKGVIINARGETAREKRSFKAPMENSRCVIPATGFYEWKRNGKARAGDKYLFKYPDQSMIYMAGAYNTYDSPDGPRESFVILTRGANEFMEQIHDRMPVLLYKNEICDWIQDEDFVDYAINRENIELDKKMVEKRCEPVQLDLFDIK